MDRCTAIEQGEIGEICVQGLVVTTEYKEEPNHTKMAKMYEGDKIWHRMGDVGYPRYRRSIVVLRKKEAPRCLRRRRDAVSVPCEAIFNLHEAVERSALVGVNGEPVIIIERVTEFCRSQYRSNC